jgi:CRISPR/Cas system-associated exonuclease Cas4 (RecB family)
LELAQRLQYLLFSFKEHRRSPSEVYVSDLTSCFRRAWLTLRFNAEPKPSGAMVVGKLLHHALKDVLGGAFNDAQFEVECSYPLGGGWLLVGKADMVTAGEVYEFKFTKGEAFNQANPAYYAQVSAYCKMLNKAKGYLILVDRDKFTFNVLEASPDEDLWGNMLEEAKLLIEALAKDEIPTLNSPRFEWECKSCAWNAVCRNLKTEAKPIGIH